MALCTAYHTGFRNLLDGSIPFGTTACYAVLVNGYTFDSAHTAYSDVSATELDTAGDYAPVELTGKTVTLEGGQILFDCDNISFGTEVSIGPADGIVLLAGAAATPDAADPVLFYAPLSDLQSTNDTFAINVPDGLYDVTIA